MSTLQAGFGRVDITPQTGTFGSFRLAPNKRSLGVHDPLHAHALYLKKNDNALLIVSIDCVGFSAATTALFRQAIQEVVPLSDNQILLAATHTHNGAETLAEEPIADFSHPIAQVRDGVVDAVVQATANPFSARIGWNRVDLPGIAINRFAARVGGDTSKVDMRADFLKIELENGAYRGVCWHFAAHPTAAMRAEYRTSADYCAAVNRRVVAELGGFCCFLNGAAGNINVELGQRSFERSEQIGADIADKLIPAIAAPLATSPEIELESSLSEIVIPLTTKKPQTGGPPREEVLEYFRRIESMQLVSADYDGHWRGYQALRRAWWCCALEDLRKQRDSEPIQICAHRIGPVCLLTVPGEIFIECQFDLQRAFPDQRTLIIGYANGYVGYIPDSESYETDAYETIPSLLQRAGKEAGTNIVTAGIELIRALPRSAKRDGGQM